MIKTMKLTDAEGARKIKAKSELMKKRRMEKAAEMGKDCIFAVGNAPTALVRLYELINYMYYKIFIAYDIGDLEVSADCFYSSFCSELKRQREE